jgi:hypothetical protein
MKKALMSIIALAVVAVAFTGCTRRIGDFTMVTTKNYERQVQYKMVGRMEGKSIKMMILFIPTGQPDLKDAVDEAIQAGNGVYLANAVIEYTNWYALLFGQFGYTVTGDVYAPVDHGDLLNPAIEKFELKADANGHLSMQSTRTGTTVSVQDIHDVVAQ